LNNRLLFSAGSTGWKLPHINVEMEITADSRPYALLSESAQWRCDVTIAEAISHISGLKFMLVDRFDILDLPSRMDLINWLRVIAKDGDIDTCLLFGTLKAVPSMEGITSYWLEGGLACEALAVAS